MAWELFYFWEDLQFRNYGESEQLEDGTVAAWILEDHEIYGNGGSSGPYGTWEDDIRAWLDGGSLIAREIIDWSATERQANGVTTYMLDMVGQRSDEVGVYVNGIYYPAGGAFSDASPVFGPDGSGAEHEAGDIVVTGTKRHWDNSISYQLASYDPYTHEMLNWVEHASFLDIARANADTNVIKFVNETGSDFTLEELAAIDEIKAMVPVLLAALQQLDDGGYFEVQGWGKIAVSELISLLARADWEVHPNNAFDNGGVGEADRRMGNPEFRIERQAMVEFSSQPEWLIYYILHETSHVTRAGDRAGREIGPGYRIETMTNDVAKKSLKHSDCLFTTIPSIRPGTAPLP